MSISIHRPGDNKKPNITFTDKALKHFNKQLTKAQQNAVRLSVKRSGCSGYRYDLTFVEEKEPDDIDISQHEVPIYVAEDAVTYLEGMEIDLVTKGLNHQISFHNPNATATCGCGESFAVDPIE